MKAETAGMLTKLATKTRKELDIVYREIREQAKNGSESTKYYKESQLNKNMRESLVKSGYSVDKILTLGKWTGEYRISWRKFSR